MPRSARSPWGGARSHQPVFITLAELARPRRSGAPAGSAAAVGGRWVRYLYRSHIAAMMSTSVTVGLQGRVLRLGRGGWWLVLVGLTRLVGLTGLVWGWGV